MLFCHFGHLIYSNFKMTFKKSIIAALFGSPNIFCMFYRSPQKSFFIISATFFGNKNIEMGHSFLRFVFSKIIFCNLLALFIYYIAGKIFLSSSISGSKPWNSFICVYRTFKKYCTVSYFLSLRDSMSKYEISCIYMSRNLSKQLRMRN